MIKNWIFLKQETDELIKMQAKGKFVFNIHPELNKQEIKAWIEKSFLTKVLSINTQCLPKKKKRRGRHIAYPIRYKTIVVTINPKILKASLVTNLGTNDGNLPETVIKKETIDNIATTYDTNIINY